MSQQRLLSRIFERGFQLLAKTPAQFELKTIKKGSQQCINVKCIADHCIVSNTTTLLKRSGSKQPITSLRVQIYLTGHDHQNFTTGQRLHSQDVRLSQGFAPQNVRLGQGFALQVVRLGLHPQDVSVRDRVWVRLCIVECITFEHQNKQCFQLALLVVQWQECQVVSWDAWVRCLVRSDFFSLYFSFCSTFFKKKTFNDRLNTTAKYSISTRLLYQRVSI